MRKVTTAVCSAFLAGNALTQGNTHTDGQALYLHGNKIAERRAGVVYVTTAGWNTATTRERLKGVGAAVHVKAGQLYKGGKAWDGEWAQID